MNEDTDSEDLHFPEYDENLAEENQNSDFEIMYNKIIEFNRDENFNMGKDKITK